MCNLYEYDMTAVDMRLLEEHSSWSTRPISTCCAGRNEATKVYPNYGAPVIRSLAMHEGIVRDMVPMRWGFPSPPFYASKAIVTNVRNPASNYWKPYLKAGRRCLVSATRHFPSPTATTASPSSSADLAGQMASCSTSPGSGANGRVTGTKKVPNVGKHLLYSFLTTRPCRCC